MEILNINIVGLTASGKTTISQIIKEALENKGFKNVHLIYDIYDSKFDKEIHLKKIKAIKNKEIIIRTIQANKKGD
jgi:uridine kinase